jgi:hypothetical protein
VTAVELELTGGWDVALLEFGRAGEWVGPGFPEWMLTPMNGVLLRGHRRTILVDTGSGVLAHLGPFDGIESSTAGALSAAGVAPTDVDTVVHLNDDHLGGLLEGTWPDDLELAFPGARVVASRAAVAAVDAGVGLPVGVAERRQLVGILRPVGVVDEAGPGDEVADGVRLRDASGRRGGHVCVEVAGAQPPVHPKWDSAAGEDPVRALATRHEVPAEVAETGARAVASHLPRAFGVAPAAGGGFERRGGAAAA